MANSNQSNNADDQNLNSSSLSDSHPWAPLLNGDNNQLSGFVMMGDSWLGSDRALTNILASNTNADVHNVAIGGSNSENTLAQLTSFIAEGGSFAKDTTVIMNLGINDFLQGTDRSITENNLNQIAGILGDQGVNIILSGAPDINSFGDLQNKQNDSDSGSLKIADLYTSVAEQNSNVKIVDVMSTLLENTDLIYSDGIHTNAGGQANFNAAIVQALEETGIVSDTQDWGLDENHVKAWEFVDQVFGEEVVVQSLIQDQNNNYNATGEIVDQFADFRQILLQTPDIQAIAEDQREGLMVQLVQDYILENPDSWKDALKDAITPDHIAATTEPLNTYDNSMADNNVSDQSNLHASDSTENPDENTPEESNYIEFEDPEKASQKFGGNYE